ncbi:MAG TPA: sulfotransferase [Herpetosiphonaceae bacterium]
MEHGPIFVGGADRSGKTLMRLSLSAHPDIAMTRRTYMWTYFYGRYGDLSQRENFNRCLAAMLQHAPMQVLQPHPERIRREFGQGEPTYARLFALFHGHYAQRLGKRRWGEQVGAIEGYADQILAAYPNARLIHMIRDPRERFSKIRASARADKSPVGSAAARWRHSVRLARANLRRYPDCYLVVRYESLIADREATLREVCDFLGEEFIPGMVTLENAMRFSDDPRLDRVTDVPESIGAANVEPSSAVSRRELAFMQSYAGQEMLAYGYSMGSLRLSLKDRLVLALVDWPTNMARAAVWHALETLHASFPAQITRKQLIAKTR